MTITQLIYKYAPHLHVPGGLVAEPLLWAVYHSEKYTPINPNPRFEPIYAPGGYYYEVSQSVRDAWFEYGRDVACSYSNFQILYIVATELGYIGPPKALDQDRFALPWVIKYINKRCLDRGADTPEEVADAYNSGSYTDTHKPEAYMKRFRTFYDKALARMESCPQDTMNKPVDSTTEPQPSPGE